MKTSKLFYYITLGAFVFFSCEKSVIDKDVVKTSTISAEIAIGELEDNDVKTDYDIANPATSAYGYFHWSGIESINVLSYSGSTIQQARYVSATNATTEKVLTDFTGTDDGNQIGFALYPSQSAGGDDMANTLGWQIDGTKFNLYLSESLEYNAANPLKDIIPMVGKLIDGVYNFVPVTGVIGVRLKNIPVSARKITISSNYALSGYYRLTSSQNETSVKDNLNTIRTGGLTLAMGYYAGGDGSNTKTFTFTSALDKDEHDFYFPVSVGGDYSFGGITISIKDGDDNELQKVTTTKSITPVRGQISMFPLMDLAKATKLAISGDATRFYAYLTALGPEAAKVKVAVASTADAALTAAALSSKIITATGDENKVEVSDALSTSGKYYLAYRVYTSTDVELYSNTQPVFFVNSTDANAIVGTFSRSVTSGEVYSGGTNAPPTSLFKFIVSTDPTKGNIMMTAMDTFDPFTSNIPGVFKPDTESAHALWLRFYNADLKKGFASNKYLFNGSSPTSNDLIFVFTSDEKDALYVGAGQYGVATTNVYPPTWHYVYNGNSSYPYAKQQ